MRLKKFAAFVLSLASGAILFGAAGFAQTYPETGQPHPWQLGLQPAASPIKARMEDFHNLLLVIIVTICLVVLGLLAYVVWRFNAKRHPVPSRTSHNTLIEVVWTIIPVLILLVIAVPSFRLLYFIDRTANPEMTLIVHGYQWYWGYEYPDQQVAEYSSYMIPDNQIHGDQVRLLSVDNPIVLPVNTNIQILVTASDVLHSFAVPAFGLKTDGEPGRMNETWVRIDREGTYYGQCSELCGTNHGFMPIEVHAVSREAFNNWVRQKTAGLDLPRPPVLLAVNPEPAAAGPQQLAQNVAQ